ncbi:hypothetical protein [Streptomyces sp. NPDC020681]|uniref:hypothetical protein n=1 Tax=Streptomyces sp. NPDC020681 TaxID=3365083 RepID=UPI0037A48BE0
MPAMTLMVRIVSRAEHLRQVIALAEGGRHGRAVRLAAACRAEAVRLYGAQSPDAVLWTEAEAHTAYLGRDPLRSCQAWMSAAIARLAAGEAVDSADVEAAVDRAHHQWQQLTDACHITRLAPELIALRLRVPGRRPGAVTAIDQRYAAHGI